MRFACNVIGEREKRERERENIGVIQFKGGRLLGLEMKERQKKKKREAK